MGAALTSSAVTSNVTTTTLGLRAGSGTRDGFESITGTKDKCRYRQELTSTGAVISAVASSENAIGYASLSAVEGQSGIKALTVNGVACTEATVLDGSYQIQRPFVLVTVEGKALSAAAQSFFDYATSADAADIIAKAGTVVWNGPVGVFEFPNFRKGTEIVANAIADSEAFSIAGGGDTLAAIDLFGIADKISYISTGGGAFLEFVEGKVLPAVAMLEERAKK